MDARFLRFLAGAALSAWTTAAALDVELEYRRLDQSPPGTYLPTGYQAPEPLAAPPAGSWKLPELQGPDAVYALAALGEGTRLLVLDRARSDDTFYTRLRFDTDGDGDLAEEEAVAAAPTDSRLLGPSRPFAMFPPIDLSLEDGGRQVPYSFVVRAYMRRPAPEEDEKLFLYLSSNCAYTGTVTLEGQAHSVVIGDGNANGSFCDKASIPAGAIGEGFGLRGTADFFNIMPADDASGRPTLSLLGDFLIAGADHYRVGLSIPDKRLTLTPVTEGLVSVTLPFALNAMSLCTEDGNGSVMLFDTTARVKLPPGTYRYPYYTAFRRDAQGDLWSLTAVANGATPPLRVTPGGLSGAAFGEPFIPSVEITMVETETRILFGLLAGKTRKVARLGVRLAGAGKEVVSSIRHVSGNGTTLPRDSSGFRPKEPAYRIAKTDGELIAEGSFRYG